MNARRTTIRAAAATALTVLALAAPRLAAQSADEAAAAWNAGEHDRARSLYATRVAADSADVQALHRLGLLLAWNRDYAAAIPLLERVNGLAASTAARTDLANVLAWSRDYDRALALIDAVLRDDPSTAALHARARFLSWAGRYDAAEAAYRSILETDPADAEALRGRARVTSWRGDLGNGERLWRRAVTADPDNADARIGLSQVLRWTGRPRHALVEAQAAARARPGDRDALEQLAWAEAAFAPRVVPTFSAEFDSDDNRLFTAALGASAHMTTRLAFTLNGYLRRADDAATGSVHRESRAGSFGVRLELGHGWTVAGSGGVIHRPALGRANATAHASVASPGWLPVTASVGYAHGVLDSTAELMGQRITTDEGSVAFGARLAPWLRLETGGSLTRFHGEQQNDRVLGRIGFDARANSWLRVRPRITAFRFEHSPHEGYFAPDRYGLAELGLGLDRYRGAWAFNTEVAPGAQKIGSSGDVQGALSARARVGYSFGAGREVGVSFSMSNLGIERFRADAAGYRYQAAVLSAAWGF